MKQLFLFVILSFLSLTDSYADKVKFTVNGTARPNVTQLEVRHLNGDDFGGTLIKTIDVKDGRFTYNGTLPGNSFIMFREKSEWWNVVITDGPNITLDMNNDNAYGTPLNEKLFSIAHNIATKGNGYEKERMDLIHKEIENNSDNCIPAYIIAYNHESIPYEKLIEYEQSGAVYTNSSLFEMTRQYIKKLKPLQDLVGKKFKHTSALSGDGKKHKFSEYIGHGNYVFVSFWSYRFSSSHREIPYIAECFNKYKPNGFNVVSVSFDKNRTQWINGISKFSMIWTQLLGDDGFNSNAAIAYKVKSLPFNFLCDGDGTIIAVNLTGTQLESKLTEVYSTAPITK